MKDWTGNKQTAYTTIGASNHIEQERVEHDFYATDPVAIDLLLQDGKAQLSHNLWEVACGSGHLSKRLTEFGYNVKSTDLIYRGFGQGGVDFLSVQEYFDGDIITNPPYKYAQEFVEHALQLIPEGNKVYMFLKLTFLEGQKRRGLFDTKQLKTVYVSSKRISCARNGDFVTYPLASAIAYAWYEFEKGYNGDPKIIWIN